MVGVVSVLGGGISDPWIEVVPPGSRPAPWSVPTSLLFGPVPLWLEQPLEERAVPLQAAAQVVGRDLLPRRPLLLEVASFAGEAIGQGLDELADEGKAWPPRRRGAVR